MAIALAVGCGGDGGSPERTTQASTTVTTGSLGKEQYLARINRYCRTSWIGMMRRYAEFQREREPGVGDAEFFAEAARSFIIPGIQFQFDRMRVDGAPEGDEQQVEEMVGTMQLEIEHGQDRRIRSPQQLTALFLPYNHLAQRYGLRECLVREAFFGRLRPQELAP